MDASPLQALSQASMDGTPESTALDGLMVQQCRYSVFRVRTDRHLDRPLTACLTPPLEWSQTRGAGEAAIRPWRSAAKTLVGGKCRTQIFSNARRPDARQLARNMTQVWHNRTRRGCDVARLGSCQTRRPDYQEVLPRAVMGSSKL